MNMDRFEDLELNMLWIRIIKSFGLNIKLSVVIKYVITQNLGYLFFYKYWQTKTFFLNFYRDTHTTSEEKNPFGQNDEDVNDGGFFGSGTRTVVGEPPPSSQSNTVLNGGNILAGNWNS